MRIGQFVPSWTANLSFSRDEQILYQPFWGVARNGHSQKFPRWVPLMLEMMDPKVTRKPPDEATYRPSPRSDDAERHAGG